MTTLNIKLFSEAQIKIIAGIIGSCDISIQDRVKVADNFFKFFSGTEIKKEDYYDMMLEWCNDDE